MQDDGKRSNGGDLTHEELVAACKNIGYDLTCGACAAIFYTGVGLPGDVHTCKTEVKVMWCLAPEHMDLVAATRELRSRMPGCLKDTTEAALLGFDGRVEEWLVRATLKVEVASSIPAKIRCRCGGKIIPTLMGARCEQCGDRNPKRVIHGGEE